MTSRSILPAALLLVMSGPALHRLSGAEPAPTPVLLELFTSEGCSSCPAADRLLETLDRTQPVAGADLIVLSEHVDYWNRLGWRDPYSSSVFSARQQTYVDLFRLDSAYTPQLVVDGRAELVGSDVAAARKAIARAIQEQKNFLQLTVGRQQAGNLAVHVKAPPLAQAARFYVAVADNQRDTQVMRGENGGRLLKHVAVVRTLTEIGKVQPNSGFDREVTVPLPPDTAEGSLRVVVFAQDAKSQRVVGVVQQKLIAQ